MSVTRRKPKAMNARARPRGQEGASVDSGAESVNAQAQPEWHGDACAELSVSASGAMPAAIASGECMSAAMRALGNSVCVRKMSGTKSACGAIPAACASGEMASGNGCVRRDASGNGCVRHDTCGWSDADACGIE